MTYFRKHHAMPLIAALGLSLWVTQAAAESWADRTVVNGFMSARYSITDESLYFQGTRQANGINRDGSFYGTKLGLNIRSHISKGLSMAAQLRSNIEDSNYTTFMDWAFARFNLSHGFAVRAGKIKYPVGLVNEYVDVGVSYPWIQAPLVIYSTSQSGPQATREAYTGSDVLWNGNFGDWTLGADLFGGQVDLTGMTIKKMRGITARANWNDLVLMQASHYTGKMVPGDPTTTMGMMMDNKSHSATEVGAKMDWNNVVAYAEWAKVKMAVKMMGVSTMDSTSWYTTLGYRFAHRILPHFTYQHWRQGDGDGHKISTIGVSYTLSPSSVLKLEYSDIKTDKAGLFVNDSGVATAPGSDTKMTSIAVDIVF